MIVIIYIITLIFPICNKKALGTALIPRAFDELTVCKILKQPEKADFSLC